MSDKWFLATFMGVDQRTGEVSNPHIPRVVSKSDSNHGTATMAHRTLGLMPAGTICHSNLSLSYYPILTTPGSEESRVLGVGSIPVAILLSCQDMKILHHNCTGMSIVG